MKRVLTPEQMRACDADHAARHGGTYPLMEAAGSAVARAALRLARGTYGTSVLVVCGKGNNAGDGFVSARRIKEAGGFPIVVSVDDPSNLKGDAAEAFRRLGHVPVRGLGDLEEQLIRSDVVVDAIFGTGFRTPLADKVQQAIISINASSKPVLAVDMASGIDPSTGGADVAIKADVTMALGALKPGHVLGKGRILSGSVEVVDIGIDLAQLDSGIFVPEASEVSSALPVRPVDSHKRSVGKVLVVAGSTGMGGAAVLAALGSYRSGAGLVRMAVPETISATTDLAVLEALTVGVPATRAGGIASGAADSIVDLSETVDAVVLGPGLGRDDETLECVRKVVSRLEKPLVLDADGLTAFSSDPEALAARVFPTVLTPHAGELARLMSRKVEDLNADRMMVAIEVAKKTRSTVLFKGYGTVVADPDGHVAVVDRGGPVLATAGTGDVLAGVIGSLLTGSDAFTAAYAGAWLHGRAGDLLRERSSTRGPIARDLVEALPWVLKEVAES